MIKLWTIFLTAIILTGLIDIEAYGTIYINDETSYLFLGDTGYASEGVDFNCVDIYDNSNFSKTADI